MVNPKSGGIGSQVFAQCTHMWGLPRNSPKSLIVADVIRTVDADRGIYTENGGIGGAKSIKLRNLLFNSKTWPYLFAETALNTTAVPSIPAIWLIVALAASILLYRSFKAALTIDLTVLEATVLWSLMKHHSSGGAEEPDLFKTLKKERRSFGLSEVPQDDLVKALHHLDKLGCIELLERKWQIIEKIYLRDNE